MVLLDCSHVADSEVFAEKMLLISMPLNFPYTDRLGRRERIGSGNSYRLGVGGFDWRRSLRIIISEDKVFRF